MLSSFFLRSVGCTVVEMLTGKPPLGDLKPQQAMYRLGSSDTEPTMPEGISLDALELLQASLARLVPLST